MCVPVRLSVCLTWAPKYVHMSVCLSVRLWANLYICLPCLTCLPCVRLVCSSLSARIFNDFLTFSFSLDIFCCQPLCWQTFFLSYTLSWPLLKYELITIWLQAQSQTQAHTYPHTHTHTRIQRSFSTHFLGFCCLVVSFWYVELAFVRSALCISLGLLLLLRRRISRCLFIAVWVCLLQGQLNTLPIHPVACVLSSLPSLCL